MKVFLMISVFFHIKKKKNEQTTHTSEKKQNAYIYITRKIRNKGDSVWKWDIWKSEFELFHFGFCLVAASELKIKHVSRRDMKRTENLYHPISCFACKLNYVKENENFIFSSNFSTNSLTWQTYYSRLTHSIY